MKKNKLLVFAVLFAVLLLSACQGQPSAVTTDSGTAATAEPSSAPIATTVPETTALEETVPETTLPERVYVPQDPDPIVYPEGEVQATLLCFADMLYVHDNTEGAEVSALPEGYYYIGTVLEANKTQIPARMSQSCHIPTNTQFYASLEAPDYLYYFLDGTYRRMIRAALVENYWDAAQIDAAVPEDYVRLFFQNLMMGYTSHNPYHSAAHQLIHTPAEVDVHNLFYNGFYEERSIQLTEDEKAFLLSDGWGKSYPVGNAKRLPVWRMDTVLQRFFGISFSDTNSIGLEQMDSYWDETDCYYVWRSDSMGQRLTVTGVTHDDETDVYEIYYTLEFAPEPRIMTLQRAGDVFLIRANRLEESAG